MSGFLIEVGPHCLTDPQEADLPAFDAAMMYPSDAARRADYQNTLKCLLLIEAARAGGTLIHPDVAMRILNATPMREFHRDAIARGHKALIAGWILIESIARHDNAEPGAMLKEIYYDASKHFKDWWPVGPKQIRLEAWGRYKSVSHFWAVRLQMVQSGNDQKSFPCDPANLPQFLKQAENARRKAVAFATNHSPRDAVIKPDEFARLPDDIVSQLASL